MTSWVWVVACVWAGVGIVGIVRVVMIAIFRRQNTLHPTSLDTIDDRPVVHIIVPARNEEIDLQGCLAALRAQDYDRLRITVANDRSDDRTLEIAQRHAAEDDRVRVVTIEELPAGWTGKAHAMWQASRDAEGDWFCFVDVDVTLEPCAVTSAVAAAKKRGVELLTMFPRTARAGFWQQVGVPYLGSLLLIFFDPFRVNNPKTKTGFVNGQFLLISAPTYRALGGHECVRDYVIEDVPFGQHAKRQGVPCFVGSGEHLAEVRMYRDFRAMTTGFARILWGAFKRRWRMAAAMLILLIAAAPFVAGPLLLVHWAAGGTTLNAIEQAVLSSLCALHLLNAACFNYHVWRACGLPGIWLFTYPLAIPVAMLTVFKATSLAGRGMKWRDVSYQVDGSGKIVSTKKA